MRFEIKLGKAYVGAARPQIAEIVSEINHRIHQPRYFYWIIGVAIAMAVMATLLASIWIGLVMVAVGLGVAWKVERDRQTHRVTQLVYSFDHEIKLKFSTIQKACQILSQSEKIWLESTRKTVDDQQHNAGASHVINLSRCPVKIQCVQPPFIETNLNVWSIDIEYLTLFFLPDYILVWRRELYSAISYSALNISCDRQQINTAGAVPADARIMGKTWQHVTPDGKPDPRAKSNPQLFQVQYGLLQLQATIGFSLRLHVSNLILAEKFTKTFNSVQQWLSTRQKAEWEPATNTPETPPIQHGFENKRSAYEVLGIKPGATVAEIRAAYHHMARMNHPDKVVGLAPEFRYLAEHRMKVITDAYRSLSKQSQTQ